MFYFQYAGQTRSDPICVAQVALTCSAELQTQLFVICFCLRSTALP